MICTRALRRNFDWSALSVIRSATTESKDLSAPGLAVKFLIKRAASQQPGLGGNTQPARIPREIRGKATDNVVISALKPTHMHSAVEVSIRRRARAEIILCDFHTDRHFSFLINRPLNGQ